MLEIDTVIWKQENIVYLHCELSGKTKHKALWQNVCGKEVGYTKK